MVVACRRATNDIKDKSRPYKCLGTLGPFPLYVRLVTHASAQIDELWNSLQHPPMSYLGDNFTYRQADGSNNVSWIRHSSVAADCFQNYLYPRLGAANTPYARSVPPTTISTGALPDPGLIFDSVMVREEFKPQ